MNHLLTALCLLAACGAAAAQTFPTKPIRVVIPFVAGGSSDIVGRAIGSKFQEFLGQPAVVENKPGANGAIAAEFVAKAEPDGYTILVGSIGVFSINAALFKDLRYHPVRDFAPITLAVTTPNVLITKPALAASSMKEVVDFAKKNPGLAVTAEFDTDEQYGFGVRKGNTALVQAINETIAASRADGSYNRIYEKWFGEAPSS
jgi:tripartite-type tricarboxylate transporter receptor subunit TctC